MTNSSPVVSIVLPIYKTEQYLHQCVDSILNQSYEDFEVILVDDGSPDRCPEICDEYARRDSRVRAIHKPNGGASSARNVGIRAARGTWTMFVDPDDWIDRDTLRGLLSVAGEDVDCVISGKRFVYENTEKNKDHALPDALVRIPEDLNQYFDPLFHCSGLFCSNANLYRRELLLNNQVFFDERYSLVEDSIFIFNFFSHCRRCHLVSGLYLFIRIREGSLSRSFHENAGEAVAVFWMQAAYIREHLSKANRRTLDRQVADWFFHLTFCIYQDSPLNFAQRYALLKRYAVAAKQMRECFHSEEESFRHRILLYCLLHDHVLLLHLLISCNEEIKKFC